MAAAEGEGLHIEGDQQDLVQADQASQEDQGGQGDQEAQAALHNPHDRRTAR